MDARDRAQRVVGFKAIEAKAQDLIAEGKKPFEVKAFINGATGELARQKPDWQQYAKALNVAERANNTF
jgi:hypothetical protein